MEKPTTHRKKHFVTNAFKYMIAVSSIAGTLGIWNLLANKNLVNANSQNNTNGPSTSSDQMPLPTLVPVIKVDLEGLRANNTVALDSQPAPENTLREVAMPASSPSTSAQSVPSLTNPSSGTTVDQGAPAVLSPNPVTTTQSSRP